MVKKTKKANKQVNKTILDKFTLRGGIFSKGLPTSNPLGGGTVTGNTTGHYTNTSTPTGGSGTSTSSETASGAHDTDYSRGIANHTTLTNGQPNPAYSGGGNTNSGNTSSGGGRTSGGGGGGGVSYDVIKTVNTPSVGNLADKVAIGKINAPAGTTLISTDTGNKLVPTISVKFNDIVGNNYETITSSPSIGDLINTGIGNIIGGGNGGNNKASQKVIPTYDVELPSATPEIDYSSDVFAPIIPKNDDENTEGNANDGVTSYEYTFGELSDLYQPQIEKALENQGFYTQFKDIFFDPEGGYLDEKGAYTDEAKNILKTQENTIRQIIGDDIYDSMSSNQRSMLLTNTLNRDRNTIVVSNRHLNSNMGSNEYNNLLEEMNNGKVRVKKDKAGNLIKKEHDAVITRNDVSEAEWEALIATYGNDLEGLWEGYSPNAITQETVLYDPNGWMGIGVLNEVIDSTDGKPVYSTGRIGELAHRAIYAFAIDYDENGDGKPQVTVFFNEGAGSNMMARELGLGFQTTIPQNQIIGYNEDGTPKWSRGENEHWIYSSGSMPKDLIADMLGLELEEDVFIGTPQSSVMGENSEYDRLFNILSDPNDRGSVNYVAGDSTNLVWLSEEDAARRNAIINGSGNGDTSTLKERLESNLNNIRNNALNQNIPNNPLVNDAVITIEGLGSIPTEYTKEALSNKYIHSTEVSKGNYVQTQPEYAVFDPVSNKVITGTFSELTSMFPTLGYDANGNYNSNLRTYDVKKDAKFLTDYNANTGVFKNPYVEQLDGKLLGSNKDVLYIPTSQYAALSTLIENKPNTNPQEYLVYDEKGNINLKESAEKQQKMDWVIRSQDEIYNDEITAGNKFTRFINENITPTTDAGKGALTFISDLIGGFITGGETLTVNPKGEVSPVINPIASIPLIGTAMDIGASVSKTIFGGLGVDTSQADKTMSVLGFNSDLFDDAKKVYNDSVNIVQNTSSENILDNSWKLALETSSLFNPLSKRLYEYEEAQGNSLERMLDVASIALLPVGVGAGGVAAKAGTKIIPSAIKGIQKGASKTIKPLTYYKPVNEISENVVKNAAKEISTNASKFDVNPLNLGDYFAEVGAKAAGNTNLIKTYGTKLQQHGDLKVQKISNALKKGKSYAETTAEEVLNTAKGEGLKTFGKEAFDSVNALSTSYMLQDKNMTPEEKLSTMTTSLIFGAGLGGATRGLSALTRADNIIGKGANFITQPVFGVANKVATGVEKKTTDVFGKKVGNVLGTGAGFITGAATTPAAAPLTAMSLIYGADVVNRIATSDNKAGTGIDIYASEILPMILGGKSGYSGVNKILSRFRDLKITKNYLTGLNERLTSSDINVRNEAKNEKQMLLDKMFSDSKKKGLIDDYSMDILTDPKYVSALDAYLSSPVKVDRKTIRNYIEANTLPETAGDPMIATFRPQYLTEENIKTAFRENRYGEKPLKTPEGYEMTESTTPVIRRIKEQYGDEYSLGYHATPYGKPFKNGEMPVLESTSEISGIYTASRPQEHYAKVEDLNKINFSPFAKFVDKDPMVVGILSKEGFQPQTTAFANNNMHLYKKHFGKSSVKPNTKAWYKVQSEIAKEVFKENPENRVVIPRMKTEMERIVFTGGVLEPVKMPPQWIMIKGERVPIVMKALSKNKIAIPKRDENGNLILDKQGKTQWDIVDYVAEKSVPKSKLSNSEKIELERFEEYVKEYDGVLRPEEKISADRRSGYEYQKSESSMGLGNIVWGGLFKNSSSPNKSKSSTERSYKGTGEYGKSPEYSRSTEYPHSSEHSKSGEYSKPDEYSHSSEYSKSGEYSRSSEYGRNREGNVSYSGNHNVSNSVEEPNRKPPKPSKKNNEKKESNRGGKRKIIQRDVYHGEIYDPLEVLGMGHMASRNRNENTKFTGDYREYYEYGYNTTNRNVKKSSLKRPSHPAESFRPFRDYATFDSSELLGLPMSKQTDKIIRKQSQERLNKSRTMDDSIKFWEENSKKRSTSKNKQNELFSNDIIHQFEKQNNDMFVAHSASNWDTVYGGKKTRNTRTMKGKSTFDLIGFPKSKKTKKNPFF